MRIKEINKQYKAMHVSMGLNHVAIIVNDSILDLVDSTSSPSTNI
jgi:hypothetical protein